jgi:nucleotide-binding universal stress UspA family protein
MLKLLIGYDGSPGAADAVQDLARAGLPSAEVEALVLCVADLLTGLLGEELVHGYPAAVLKQARFHAEQLVAEARTIAQEGADRLRSLFPDWTIAADAAADSPYWGLVKRAEQLHVDLLVVGSQGRSAFGRLMLGSVSQNAVLYATCSARIGRRRQGQSAGSTASPVRIIIGWDGSDDASAAVRAVASRPWPPGSRARLVSAIDLRLSTAVLPGELAALPLTSMPDERTWLTDRARAAADSLRATGLEVDDPLVRPGDPKRVLVDEADAFAADCIFVGAKGQSRVQRILLGSVSGAVAARASCSVEVVRG